MKVTLDLKYTFEEFVDNNSDDIISRAQFLGVYHELDFDLEKFEEEEFESKNPYYKYTYQHEYNIDYELEPVTSIQSNLPIDVYMVNYIMSKIGDTYHISNDEAILNMEERDLLWDYYISTKNNK